MNSERNQLLGFDNQPLVGHGSMSTATSELLKVQYERDEALDILHRLFIGVEEHAMFGSQITKTLRNEAEIVLRKAGRI